MDLQYSGNELDLFAEARHWKSYWSQVIRKYVSGDVLEVGGGLGANIPFLMNDAVRSLTILEPDPVLYERLQMACHSHPDSARLLPQKGALPSLTNSDTYSTVLYLDVLEHIDDDRREVERAAAALRPAGHLIVLVPAHQFLYSPFDKAIGHYRRYSRRSLAALCPPGCRLMRLQSLDTVGLIASLSNAVLLRQSVPTIGQIRFWDRMLVPMSRNIDRLTAYRTGKSIVSIWRKDYALSSGDGRNNKK